MREFPPVGIILRDYRSDQLETSLIGHEGLFQSFHKGGSQPDCSRRSLTSPKKFPESSLKGTIRVWHDPEHSIVVIRILTFGTKNEEDVRRSSERSTWHSPC